jgi:hypothetical protein
VLALWTYGSFTFGHVPYLDLASNGSDPNERSARGYIQGRHIGKSLYWYPAVTAGLRLLIVRETHANLCLDYGVGLQGQHGFYLSFNEAF